MAIPKKVLREKQELKKRMLEAEKKNGIPYGIYTLFNAYIELKGLTDTECFDLCGLRKSDLKRMMTNDSMELSAMINFTESNGDTISFSFFGEGLKEDVPVDYTIFLKKHTLELARLSFITLAFRQKGIKRSEVAKKLGVHSSTLQKWFEKDDIRFRKLIKIAQVLECSLNMDIRVTKKRSESGHPVFKGTLTYTNEDNLD